MPAADATRQSAGRPAGISYPRRYGPARQARHWFPAGAGGADQPPAAAALADLRGYLERNRP
ncbi:MAG: hypothetical protein KKA73_30015 [Chloroflexi bacterium]|nr:hypothetical protein [Chloroflexota bacterium]